MPTPSASIGPFGSNPVEAEVRANILAQPLVDGRAEIGTAANLNIPERLLARIADRIIRATFEERYRNVREDRPGRQQRAGAPPFVLDREHWPALRGYRAPIDGDDPWPRELPGESDPPELRQAALHITARLAGDGLARALADTFEILSPLLRNSRGATFAAGLLRRAGFPIDLLDYFTLDSRPLLERTLSLLSNGAPRHAVAAEMARARFDFRATRPGFRAVDESGIQSAGLFRVQMTRAGHWEGEGGGPGSGDSLDLLLHLLRALPGARFVVSVAANHADGLSASLDAAGVDASRLVVLPAELPVSQWAQDNLKPGLIADSHERVALLPRYASRAEEGAKLDAGDTAALAHLAAAGITTIHSPLHFQGGNVMLVRRASGARLLLVGEAEVARNVTLGLTPGQAGDALRIEMGADEILVLPAVGFHLDTELSIRRVGNELIAFVPDEVAAARLILQSATRSLELAGAIARADAKVFRTFLDARNDEKIVERFAMILGMIREEFGAIPASFADAFRSARGESGAANLWRVMLAIDLLTAGTRGVLDAQTPPHAIAFIRSLVRSRSDRGEMHASLAAAGMRVIPVPSISAGNRSASVINAVHLPDRVLVPVRGGFFKPLDDAAIKAMRSHLPAGLQIVPIPAAESERRGGAVHCSVGVFPDPNE